MKKIILLAGLVLLAACQKETECPQGAQETGSSITFELTADYSGATKAVKTGWEAGDVIFVFFEGAQAPRHLQLRYDGTSWTAVQMNGDAEGDIGLFNGQQGLMRAVYLPFGNDSVICTDDSGKYFFSNASGYSYWLTATLHYVVKDNKVSGAFNMCIPDGMVQFWIEDSDAAAILASNTNYLLFCPAVEAVKINSIFADTLDIDEGSSYPGGRIEPNAYEGGFLFAARLVDGYSNTYGIRYLFRKEKREHSGMWFTVERVDLYVEASTPIQSHDAIILPSNESSRWLSVMEDNVSVELNDASASLGRWKVKNFGSRFPGEMYSSTFDFATALSLGETIPSRQEWEALIAGLTWAPIVVGEDCVQGLVGVDKDNNYIFLENGKYWTSTQHAGITTNAYYVLVDHLSVAGAPEILSDQKDTPMMVRALAGSTDPSLSLFNPERTL